MEASVAHSKHPRGRSHLLWIFLLLAIAGTGVWFWLPGRRAGTSTWQTRPVSQGAIVERVLTTGNLEPIKTVSVGSQVSGIVQKLFADFNSVVHKGDLVARIDPSTLLAQEQQAKADLDTMKSALFNAQANQENAVANQQTAVAGVQTAQAGIASAQAQQATAQAQLEQARAALYKAQAQLTTNTRAWQRARLLTTQGFMTKSDLDTATSNYESSQADVRAAQGQIDAGRAAIRSASANLESAQTQLSAARYKETAAESLIAAAQSQVASAQDQIRKSQAGLDQIRINLGYCTIRSPVDGIVIARLVDEGQTVAASFQTPTLFSVGTDLRNMQVYANVDEGDISRVYLKQNASFKVDAYPDEDFPCVVSDIRNSPTSINNVVTYQVLLDVHNDDMRLKPGMTANITLVVAHRDTCVRIPNVALRFHPPGTVPLQSASGSVRLPNMPVRMPVRGASPAPSATPEAAPLRRSSGRVYRAEGNTLVPVDVTLGLTDGINTEMVSGPLQAGDAVVVSAVQSTPPSGH